MLVVISPAKNLDFESALPKLRTTQPQMLDQAEHLIQNLKALAPHEVSELMRLSDKLGQLNYDRYQAWSRPFNVKNARPAALAFNGDVYQGLEASSFSAEDFAFAQQHLRILSGLYGVLRPLDLMQPYRLEMGTRLATDKGRDLYAYWGEAITQALNQQLKKTRADTLVNLASNEYFRAVKPKTLKATVIEPVFKDWKNGEYKIVSFLAKKARGLMSAYIVKHRLTQPEALQNFEEGGYTFNPSLSSEQKWVFTRKA